MPTELRWIISVPASALHAVAAMLDGKQLLDVDVVAALTASVDQLRHDLATLTVDIRALLEHWIPLSVQLGDPRSLAAASLAKAVGPDVAPETAACLARKTGEILAAFTRARPRAIEELELRSAPLREQWEARGPGLLAGIGRLTEPSLIVDAADVILTHPVLGGGGVAHPRYNSLRIEAVLANPLAALPEVVRLAWLIAQLNLDMPNQQGLLRWDRMLEVGRLALIPPMLAAAEDVELVRNTPETLALALREWAASPVSAQRLAEWWDVYQSSKPPWGVALGALDRMLRDNSGSVE